MNEGMSEWTTPMKAQLRKDNGHDERTNEIRMS